jgi:hypothetical protein
LRAVTVLHVVVPDRFRRNPSFLDYNLWRGKK